MKSRRRKSKKRIFLLITVIVVILIALFAGGDKTTKFNFTATYVTQSGQTYVETGSGETDGKPACPPFQNGGKDLLLTCEIDIK